MPGSQVPTRVRAAAEARIATPEGKQVAGGSSSCMGLQGVIDLDFLKHTVQSGSLSLGWPGLRHMEKKRLNEREDSGFKRA